MRILMVMSMVFVIVDMLMGVHPRLVAVFVAAVAVAYFLMGVLVLMLLFIFMGVSMMSFIVGVLMSMNGGLMGVFMAVVAMGHFLMGVLMLMLVFLGHGYPPDLFIRRPIGKLHPKHGAIFGVLFGAVRMLDGLLFLV